MADGKVIIDTDLDSSGVEQGLSKLEGVARAGMTAVAAAVAAATAAIVAMGGYAVKVGSDFEAGMSKVGAISGATGEDLEQLTEKAKEMGAKTKFSATEASEAFSYMAMAGWKTADMLDGIDGIMNLAAASGEDLASVSDIVTDALTAFGLQASDSAHFADVLAKASSNSNTNVGMMGATFKYVAPLAGAMGYSIEDTAVAIGLMANAGIKGEQAGTSMRAMLTRLASPTNETASAMEALGINISNADGSMKPFNEVLGQLRSSFAGLTEEQKTQYASAIAGQEAMSGLLAIVGASESDFNKLTGAINNADGAAQDMAETMQDNLQGKITILKSSLEGFGIQIYESMEEPLKGAAEAGIEAIGRISNAFKAGGFKGAVKEAGEVISDLIDDVSRSDTAFGKAASAIKPLAEALTDIASVGFKAASTAASFLADNMDILVPILKAAVAGFVAFKVIDGVVTKFSALKAAIGLLSNPLGIAIASMTAFLAVGGAIEAYVTRQTESEKKHTDALKESSRAAEESLNTAKARRESYEELSEAQDKQAAGDIAQLDRLASLNSELSTIVDANGMVMAGEEDRAAFITSQLSDALGIEISLTDNQIQNYQELQSQIQSLIEQKRIDAIMSSQQVKYEEAVANQMQVSAEAYQNLTAMKKAQADVDKETAELESLKAEKIQATIDGNKGLVGVLGEKIEKQKEDVATAKEALTESQEAYAQNTAALEQYANDIDLYTSLAEAAATGNGQAIEQAIAQITAGIKTANNATAEELQKQVVTVAEHEAFIRQEVENGSPGFTQSMVDQASQATLAAMEEFAKAAPQTANELAKVPPEAIAALIAGDMQGQLSAEASGAVDGMLEQFEGLDEDTRDVFAECIYGALEGLEGFEQVKDPAKEGADAFLESLRDALQVHSPSAAVAEIFGQVWPGATEGLNQGSEGLLSKGTEIIGSFLDALGGEDLVVKAQEIGSNIMSFFGLGVSSQTENNRLAGQGNADAANAGAGSVDPTGTGMSFGSLLSGGVSAMAGLLFGSGSEIGSSSEAGFGSIDPTGTGNGFGSMLGAGVSAMAGLLFGSGSEIGSSSESGFGSINPTGTGQGFGSMLGAGVSAMAGLLFGSGSSIGSSAESGAGSINPTGTGSFFGSMFAGGIGGMVGQALAEGMSLASSANTGASSQDGSDAGSNFGSGFVSGIGSWIGRAISAGASLAASALQAAKNALDVRSPSRKAAYVGRMFDQGFTDSIEDGVIDAERASAKLANAALNGLDVSAMADKMRVTVASEQSNMSSNITAKVTRVVETQYENATNQDEFMDKLVVKMAGQLVDALAKSGLTVVMDKKPVGKLLTPEVDKNMRLRRV